MFYRIIAFLVLASLIFARNLQMQVLSDTVSDTLQ
jgi:hypothetical protein